MKLSSLDLTTIADFARKEYRDRPIDPHMPSDEHWARCWVQALMIAMSKDGGKVMHLSKDNHLTEMENV
jgi:hypothetical protein